MLSQSNPIVMVQSPAATASATPVPLFTPSDEAEHTSGCARSPPHSQPSQQLPITNDSRTETSGKHEFKQEEEERQQQKQPHYSNLLSDLRNLSVALSSFQLRYDDLQEHLDFIRNAIDAKLPKHLNIDPSLPQSLTVVPSTEILSSTAAETTIADGKQTMDIGSSSPQALAIVPSTESLTPTVAEATVAELCQRMNIDPSPLQPLAVVPSNMNIGPSPPQPLAVVPSNAEDDSKQMRDGGAKLPQQLNINPSPQQPLAIVPSTETRSSTVAEATDAGANSGQTTDYSHPGLPEAKLPQNIDPSLPQSSAIVPSTAAETITAEVNSKQMMDNCQLSLSDAKLPQHPNTEPSSRQPAAAVPSTKAETVIADANSKGMAHSSQSGLSEIQSLCKTMSARGLRKYILSNLSKVAMLRREGPAALKLAPHPARLVIRCFGRFFLQGTKAYNTNSPMVPARQVSVLILEFFLLMGCNTIEIEGSVKKEAEGAALLWRNRLVNEGGLAEAAEIDARGLLLLMGCFGIPRSFKDEDIRHLIQASNPREISNVLRRSDVLLARVPVIIEWMMKNKREVRAVDFAYTFGLENRFPPQTILATFLQQSKDKWKRARKAAEGSLAAENETYNEQLIDLKSVLKCLNYHQIDPLKVLPGWKINEQISRLEREIDETDKKIKEQVRQKRKADADELESSKRLRSQEVRRPWFAEHGPQLEMGSASVNDRHSSDGLMPINFLDGGFPGHIGFSAPSEPHRAGVGPLPGNGVGVFAAGMSGHAVDVLPPVPYTGGLVDRVGYAIDSSSQPYGWHGDASFRERLIDRSYGEPAVLGVNGTPFRPPGPSLESFAGLPNPSSIGSGSNPSSSSNLYGFADAVVESERHGASQTGGSVPARHRSSYLY